MADEWDVNKPINHTLISALPEEIRKLKASTKTQIDREHETPVDGDVTGGEHSNGSAVCYRGTDTPTNRPDGATPLASNDIDKGRLWLDDNFDPPKLKRWSGSDWIAVYPNIAVDSTTVFNTTLTASDTFQDLDLSAVVGTTVALVHLEVKSTGSAVYAVKQKGANGSYVERALAAGGGFGAGMLDFEANHYGIVVCITDANGVIEHGYQNTSDTITVIVRGFIS